MIKTFIDNFCTIDENKNLHVFINSIKNVNIQQPILVPLDDSSKYYYISDIIKYINYNSNSILIFDLLAYNIEDQEKIKKEYNKLSGYILSNNFIIAKYSSTCIINNHLINSLYSINKPLILILSN